MNLKGRNFLKLLDFTPEEIGYLIDLASELKAEKKAGVDQKQKRGKNIALIFEKTSTRTRCAFEVAAADLGIHPVYLDPQGSQIGKKESIADTARVLGRMFDGIEYRGFGQEIVEELAKYAGVPVWNGLTNEFHPTQILADFLTIKEHFGKLKGIKLVYMGDARYNMGNSLMVGAAKMGLDFVACAPEKYFPDQELIKTCKEIAKETGATLTFETDPIKATKDADVIYTDVWVHWTSPLRQVQPFTLEATLQARTFRSQVATLPLLTVKRPSPPLTAPLPSPPQRTVDLPLQTQAKQTLPASLPQPTQRALTTILSRLHWATTLSQLQKIPVTFITSSP